MGAFAVFKGQIKQLAQKENIIGRELRKRRGFVVVESAGVEPLQSCVVGSARGIVRKGILTK